MPIFSCPACSSHAFQLSSDLKQAQCKHCKASLGSWQALRATIQRNLHPLQSHRLTLLECTGMTLH
jgi:RNase P subunit RPR2